MTTGVYNGLMLPDHAYRDQDVGDGFCLATIPDFNTLVAKSQEAQTPVFALTADQIGQQGVVLQTTLRSRDSFEQIFSALADKVIGLTRHADGD